ncbi:MAG: hypothetical protein ABIR78_07825 [Ferruginibacter sp.]
MKKNIAAVLFLLMALPCCKKENATKVSNADILTTGTWRLTYLMFYDVFGDHDLYAGYPDCRKDDFFRFNKDGTEEINEGPTKCNSADPQIKIKQWKFLNSYENIIEIDGEAYYVDWIRNDEFRFKTATTDPYAPRRVIKYSR